MKSMSIKIVFFGNERLVSGLSTTSAPVLTGLIQHGYNVQAVVSHHTESKSRNPRILEVADIAKKHNIPLLLPHRPSDIIDQLASFKADLAILVAYGRIIPQRVIDIFPKGIINLHPSLLPKYRGPTPIESAIENGDPTTGVSLMRLAAGMDTGPIYAQTLLTLKGNETKFDVYESLSRLGAKLLFDSLPSIINGSLRPYPQNESHATYSRLLSKQDSLLDPTYVTAQQAERRIRAHLGFPKTRITILKKPIIITKAHVNQDQKTPLDILCKDGMYLSVDELIAPSGKQMDGSAFLRGYNVA